MAAAALAQPAAPLPGFKLVWSDEFNGSNTDLDREWDFQNGPSGHILCSRWRENAVVENGLCRLLNKKEKRGGQDWTSASLWTKRQFKYGYFECRYRYGAATGLNNSFWLMTRGGTTNTPGRFEIDINEGHFPDSVNMNIHNWSGKHWAKSKEWKAGGRDLSQDFHVYGLEWSEKELVWFFDGKEIRRETNSICHREAPVLLSSAIMKWAGPVTDKIHGTAMEVDYVRVYQRAEAQAASDGPNFAAAIQPVPESAKFIDPEYYISLDNHYWAIVKDNAGHFTGKGKSTALFESADGLEWKLARHALVATTEITWEGGRKQKLNSLERPQVFLENCKPSLLLFACDEDGKREHSFNIRVPLNAPDATQP